MNVLRTKHGSAKDIHVLREPDGAALGEGLMEFRDDYSIFDYGVMPDQIPGKGASLAALSEYNFKEVEKLGVKTHYRGNENGLVKIVLARVLYPQKNEIREGETNYLVPLEIIFRNALPAGSSVFKRIAAGETTWEAFGFDEAPAPGTRLEKPIIDVATKLEPTDRYLSWEEAMDMARISEKQLAEIKEIALKVDGYLNRQAASAGLFHEDGKIEVIVDDKGGFLVADVFGTLDENRFEYGGSGRMEVSKQILRDYYKKTPWYNELEAAKKKTDNKKEWPKPPRMPAGLADKIGNIYKSFAAGWTGKNSWNAPPLAQALGDYRAFMTGFK
ncbi:MAG: phosphoribosylaminoimidazolesuccinocarboxamide synthase [Candidatus Micrarchaeota archaeon]|nr:phosphoribosylaminoimidazolesuccinocarboxamide synthase [Candidatus Micrarchaeota archaeon]